MGVLSVKHTSEALVSVYGVCLPHAGKLATRDSWLGDEGVSNFVQTLLKVAMRR